MAFQGGSRVDPNEQIKDVDQQIVMGIREGTAFHQSPTLENGPYRSRVLGPVNPQHEGNLFSAYNASVLHTQVAERGLESPEFVKSAVLRELGHERKEDTRFEKQYWVAPNGSRMAAVGGGTVKTTGTPHAYLHVETQTTLPTKAFPLKGKLDEKGRGHGGRDGGEALGGEAPVREGRPSGPQGREGGSDGGGPDAGQVPEPRGVGVGGADGGGVGGAAEPAAPERGRGRRGRDGGGQVGEQPAREVELPAPGGGA